MTLTKDTLKGLGGNVEVFNKDGGKEKPELKLKGYALKFNTLSHPRFVYTETEGAVEARFTFREGSLDETDLSDVRFLFNHDTNDILGRTTANNLKLTVDDVGLYFELELPNTTLGRDLYENVRVGNVTQCSFMMYGDEGSQKLLSNEDGTFTLEVHKILEIPEISSVVFPAFDDTEVSVLFNKSFETLKKSKEKEDKKQASILHLGKLNKELLTINLKRNLEELVK